MIDPKEIELRSNYTANYGWATNVVYRGVVRGRLCFTSPTLRDAIRLLEVGGIK